MGRLVTIKDVPSDHKDEVVAAEQADGADVHVFDNRDGTFTVVANFPDQTDEPPSGGATPGGDGGPTTPSNLSDTVPIPPLGQIGQINFRLSSCREATMLQKFGVPGNLTIDCSDLTNPTIMRRVKSIHVGQSTVKGFDFAVESLAQIFTYVQKQNKVLFDQVKNDGMLCVRAIRSDKTGVNTGVFSNHSWGTAIDIFFAMPSFPWEYAQLIGGTSC